MLSQLRTIKRYTLILLTTWTAIILFSGVWFSIQHRSHLHETAKAEARIAYQKDTLYRKWAARHGGVYAPVTAETTPNPYLSHIPERDISTPSNKKLTLINPAYMTRQVFELAATEETFVKGHITSLNPIRRENAPDPWEEKALKAFESGTKEVSDVQEIGGQKYLRLMRPFVTEESCLKCHAVQGYKTGDIRGGISISVPMSLYAESSNQLLVNTLSAHFIIWVLGTGMISFGFRKLSQSSATLYQQKIQLENEVNERQIAQEQLQEQAAVLEIEISERQQAQEQLDLKARLLEQEITVRRQAEESALSNSMRLQLIMDSTYAALYGIDTTGACTFANKTCLTLLGYEVLEDLIGRNMHELIHHTRPDGRHAPHGECKIFKAFREGAKVTVSDEVFWRKDGSFFPVEYSSYPILSDGAIVGAVISFIDISERKQAEDALKASEEKFSIAFRVCPAMLAIVSMDDGEYVEVNEAFLTTTGYKREEVIGHTSLELGIWLDLHERQKYLDDLNTKGSIKNFEARFRMRNDEVRDFLVSSYVMEMNHRRYSLNFVIDITEHNLANQEKAKLEAQLQQAQKMESIGRLAGGVAHDFNNLLTVILGHAEMGFMKIAPSEPISADLTAIQNAAEKSAALTHQLLAFARKQVIAPKVLDLNETVEQMLKLLKRLIGEDIDLAWQPGKDLYQVKIDPSQIDQILANLCVNARDAISDGGRITIETSNHGFDDQYCAENFGYLPGEYVQLAVSDNGCGMDKETLMHVFEPFFTTKEHGQGTGLGLATVYGIVKQNDGFITIDSEPGKGTAFRIYLPCHKPTGIPSRPEDLQQPISNGRETILLVEDEVSILNLTAKLLEQLGYHVLTASSPREAIRLARDSAAEIHLLMTDVVMPEMNGQELLRNLSPLYPKLTCLFMSGYTANVIAHHGVLDENVHFIPKPFSLTALSAKVREALSHR